MKGHHNFSWSRLLSVSLSRHCRNTGQEEPLPPVFSGAYASSTVCNEASNDKDRNPQWPRRPVNLNDLTLAEQESSYVHHRKRTQPSISKLQHYDPIWVERVPQEEVEELKAQHSLFLQWNISQWLDLSSRYCNLAYVLLSDSESDWMPFKFCREVISLRTNWYQDLTTALNKGNIINDSSC